MTEQEQRIALCEWMGWHYHKPTPEEIESGSYYQYEPDTNSLDVLHEMEMKLQPSRISPESSPEWGRYIINLSKVTRPDGSLVCATAAQRREALCRTLFPERFKSCKTGTANAQ